MLPVSHFSALQPPGAAPSELSQIQHQEGCGCSACCAEREAVDAGQGFGTQGFGVPGRGIQAPLGTLDELASYLTSGYWGRAPRAFETQASNVLTVDITGLTADGKQLARWAFEAWEAVADLSFREVFSSADITFTDHETGAFAFFETGGWRNQITEAWVNVHDSWTDEAREHSVDGHGFLTYMHEIGHALGLGHQGDYNIYADYNSDAVFANDSYKVSIMSYFDQDENIWESADWGRPITPMMADILAVQQLYGAAGAGSQTWGDTVYGPGGTLGGYLQRYFDTVNTGAPDPRLSWGYDTVYTLYDAGGVDMIDFRTARNAMQIDLRPESYSSFAGRTDVMGIARGTLIEKLVTGAGNDVLTGNVQNNTLHAGKGHDTLKGGAGADTLYGQSGNDLLLGGTGADILYGGTGHDRLESQSAFDQIWGGRGDDYAVSGTGADTIWGGEGNDSLYSNTGVDTIWGEGGHDLISSGNGVDFVNGGAGNDTIYGRTGWDTLEGGTGNDVLYSSQGNDLLRGDAGADFLSGGSGWDDLYGGAGNDTLYGNFGADSLEGGTGADSLYGGTGDDTLRGGAEADALFGNQGVDVLEGEGGNDLLRGGTLRDTFVFNLGHGADRISDFELSLDRLLLARTLVGEVRDGAAVVETFGEVIKGRAVLDFGSDQSITFSTLDSLEGLDAVIDFF